MYNNLNAHGKGYWYLEMDLLVFGLNFKQEMKWTMGFMATDRAVQAVAGSRGHLVSLSTIRTQVQVLLHWHT
jgi:hypothetical protein